MRKTRAKAIQDALTVTRKKVVRGVETIAKIRPAAAVYRAHKRAHVRHGKVQRVNYRRAVLSGLDLDLALRASRVSAAKARSERAA